MRKRSERARGRAIASGLVAASVGLALLLSPAAAHVTNDVDHLWNKHLKAKVTSLAYTKKQTYTKTQANSRFTSKAYFDCCEFGEASDDGADVAKVTVPALKRYVIHGYVHVTGGDADAGILCKLEEGNTELDRANVGFTAGGEETMITLLSADMAGGTAGGSVDYGIECLDENTDAAYDDARILVQTIGQFQDQSN